MTNLDIELSKAIDSILKTKNVSPQQKLCLLWMQDITTKLICFRKVDNELQMNTSENAKEFDEIIEADKSGDWKPAKLSPAVVAKLLPLLQPIPADQAIEKKPFSIQRMWEPHFKFWNRYYDSWVNGKSPQILMIFGQRLASNYPITILNKCFDRFSGWLSK